jgi:MFS family permease
MSSIDTAAEKNFSKATFVTFIGSLFFFYAFIQCNMMGALNQSLLKLLNIGSKEIGFISGWYFYANILFLIPAGLMLDRYSIKKIMAVNMAIVALGTFIFAFAHSMNTIILARFISGIMMSFGLIACLKLASLWFPPQKMALVSALVITVGMVGGIVAQSPLSMLIESFGWRNALLVLGVLGVFLTFLFIAVVHSPEEEKTTVKNDISVWKSLYLISKEKQNWFAGLFTSLLNLPVALLGALFGMPFLTQIYKISPMHAGSILSMIFLGMIFGSPVFGAISDNIKKRKTPMLIGSFLCLFFVCCFIYISDLPISVLYALFFLIGFTSGAQSLGYPVVAESNPMKVSGSALSLAAILIMGIGYGLGLPLVGWLLDLNWQGQMLDGAKIYSMDAYKFAFLSMPIGIITSILMALFLKETNCKSISE